MARDWLQHHPERRPIGCTFARGGARLAVPSLVVAHDWLERRSWHVALHREGGDSGGQSDASARRESRDAGRFPSVLRNEAAGRLQQGGSVRLADSKPRRKRENDREAPPPLRSAREKRGDWGAGARSGSFHSASSLKPLKPGADALTLKPKAACRLRRRYAPAATQPFPDNELHGY